MSSSVGTIFELSLNRFRVAEKDPSQERFRGPKSPDIEDRPLWTIGQSAAGGTAWVVPVTIRS